MIDGKIVCSEQFREKIAQFTVPSRDFVRTMHGWDILAVTCHVPHPSDILWTHKQVSAANKYFDAFNSQCKQKWAK